MLPHEFAERWMVKSTGKILGCEGKSKEISKQSAFFKRSILSVRDRKAIYCLQRILELLDQEMVCVRVRSNGGKSVRRNLRINLVWMTLIL